MGTRLLERLVLLGPLVLAVPAVQRRRLIAESKRAPVRRVPALAAARERTAADGVEQVSRENGVSR